VTGCWARIYRLAWKLSAQQERGKKLPQLSTFLAHTISLEITYAAEIIIIRSPWNHIKPNLLIYLGFVSCIVGGVASLVTVNRWRVKEAGHRAESPRCCISALDILPPPPFLLS